LLVVLVTGICMLVSAASLFFRDVKYIVEVVLTFGIFFTPVFYDVRMLGNKGKWLLLNPAAPILEGISDCVNHRHFLNPYWFVYSSSVAIFLFVFGYIFFKHLEPAFAESI
jgi:ABC-type polysaccharide/polyol phosphate export permease